MAAANRDVTAWRKSSYSGASGGDCVEVGETVGSVLVRDTKDVDGPVLDMGPGTWQHLMATLKASI